MCITTIPFVALQLRVWQGGLEEAVAHSSLQPKATPVGCSTSSAYAGWWLVDRSCLAQFLLLLQIATHKCFSCSSLFSLLHFTMPSFMTGWYPEFLLARQYEIRSKGCSRGPDCTGYAAHWAHSSSSVQEQQQSSKCGPCWARKGKWPQCFTKLTQLQRLLCPRTGRSWCYNSSESWAGQTCFSFQGYTLKKSPCHRLWEIQ